MSQKRLFLLDAYALIFRGYYALIKNPRINSKGMDTSAILGFTNSLFDVIKREKPDHLAVAFDKGGSDIRNEAFSEYKSNRQETPEAIKIAVPYIQQLLKAMHIPIIEKEGFEADDLIGTLSVQAEKAGYQTFMVTPDKDFAQLVTENVFMYRPARMGNGIEIWGVNEVKEKFEVDDPKQVIDYLGMMGDAVDNIPGLPGVGEKTAKKFIKEYGSMEKLLANTHEIKGKLREKIEENKDLGILSKKLATILLDCPVTFNEKDFELSRPDIGKVQEIFKDLEFRRLAESLSKVFDIDSLPPSIDDKKESAKKEDFSIQQPSHQFDLFSAAEQENTSSGYVENETNDHYYQYLKTPLARKLLLEKLLQQNSVAFFIEIHENKIAGMSFSYHKGKGYYIPLGDEATKSEILQEFKTLFEKEEILKIGFDIKATIKLLSKHQICINGPLFDVMLSHYIINPDMRHDLDVLSETYLNYKLQQIENLVGKRGKNQLSFSAIELKNQTEFVCEKSDVIFQLSALFTQEMEEQKLSNLYFDIEIPLLRVLASMELEGVNVNVQFLHELSKELDSDIATLEKEIYAEANTEFNLASPKQLGDVLFDELKLISNPKKTKTGQYATGEEILTKLASEHTIVANILTWRGLVKLKNTYVDALPNEVNKESGRIHTTYSQAVASTGRLSSINPNLQNIPIRTERGRLVRKAFIPRNNDYTFVAADYSQIELRIIAALSKDESMIESFTKNEDIHAATAAKVFNISIEEVTREQRSDAKAVNFGIIYGQGAFTLAQQLNKSRTEAKELIDNYYMKFPKLKQFIANQVNFARENGYVQTILGRRRYLSNINSQNAIVRSADERNAVNAPIQGSAADIIKIAMIQIQELLQKGNYKTKMLLQVHDELIFDMHKDEVEILKPLLIEKMQQAVTLSVPLMVDFGIGNNWLEAH